MVRFPRNSALLLVLVAGLGLAGCGQDEASVLAKAKERMEKRDRAGAEIELKNVIQKFPKSGEARYLLGMQLLQRGDAPAALIELERARELHYNDNQVLPALAKVYLLAGKSRQAIDSLGAAQLTEPKAQAQLTATLAQALAREGDLAGAAAAVDKGLSTQPDAAALRLVKAQLIAARSGADAALAEVNTLLSQQADNDEAWSLKGDLLLRTNAPPADTEAAYRKALALKPDHVHARAALVALQLQNNQVDGAVKDLAELRKAAPNQFSTGLLEAYVAVARQKYPEARTVFQALLKGAPSHPLVLAGAAENELRLNDLSQAELLASKALSVAPQNPQARRVLGQTLLRKGQPDKALRLLQPLIEQPDAAPELLAMAAQAEMMAGNPKAAEALYQRMGKLKPTDPRLRTLLATAGSQGNTETMLGELQSIAATDTGITADMAILNTRLKARDFNGALAAADAIGRKQPNLPLAPYLKSVVLAYKRDLPGVRQALEEALAKDDSYLPAISGLAALDLADNKPEQAKARYQPLLKKQPNNPALQLALAELAKRTGASPAEVQGHLEAAVKAAPQDLDARQALINHHASRGDARAALTVADAGLALLPDSVDMHERVARLQLSLGDNDQALATYGKLNTKYPEAVNGLLGLARASLATGNLVQAQRNAEKALEKEPGHVEALGLLATAQARKKDFDAAIRTARQLQQAQPGQAAGFVLEADIEESRGKFAEAAMALRIATDKASQSSVAGRLHRVLVKSGKPADADSFAADWRKKHPKDTQFLAYLAEAAERAGNQPLAEQRYRDLLAVAPNHAIGMNNLAMLLVRLRKPGALPLAEGALKAAPDEPAFLDTLSEVHLAEGRLEKAIEVQTRVVERAPKVAEFRLKLARMQLQAGSKKAAKGELDRLVSDASGLSDAQKDEIRTLQQQLR